MALVFPYSLAVFADVLGIRKVTWMLQDNRELSGLGSGQILQADLAPRLWTGDVVLHDRYHDDAARIEAKLDAMIDAQGSFYLYDARRRGPTLDPNGTALGASVVKINSLPNMATMSLKGLPAAYKLSVGDYLHFDYGDPARRAFHRVAEDVTASGAGVTPVFTVTPRLRAGAAVDQIVTLIKPAMKCIVTPKSVETGSTEDMTTTSLSFSVMQKL